MVCVGIDAASTKHDVCILDERGRKLHKPFQIKNSDSDYKKLLEAVRVLKEQDATGQVRLGIESTGAYSEIVVDFFRRVDWIDVIYINPILTRMYQQTRKIHYAKTDRIDAEGIARFIATAEIKTHNPVADNVRKLREIYREIIFANKDICENKNRLKSLLHRYFPEYLDIYSDIFSVSSLWILENINDLESLGKLDPEMYRKDIMENTKCRVGKEKCKAIIESARSSVGIAAGFNSVVISSMIARIRVALECKESLLEAAEKIINETFPNLLTIPGIGIVSAAGIIGEIGNIDNFETCDALYAFTGLDPRVYESGNYKADNVRISKKGSPYLRNALYVASQCIIRFDQTYAEYFNKKIAEGKRFRNVLGHVAKKLCRLIFRLMKTKENYIPATIPA